MSLKPNKNSQIDKQKVKVILSMLKEEKELKEVEASLEGWYEYEGHGYLT